MAFGASVNTQTTWWNPHVDWNLPFLLSVCSGWDTSGPSPNLDHNSADKSQRVFHCWKHTDWKGGAQTQPTKSTSAIQPSWCLLSGSCGVYVKWNWCGYLPEGAWNQALLVRMVQSDQDYMNIIYFWYLDVNEQLFLNGSLIYFLGQSCWNCVHNLYCDMFRCLFMKYLVPWLFDINCLYVTCLVPRLYIWTILYLD